MIVPRLRELFPSLADLRQSAMAILRGTGIGFGCGLIPGPAPVIATYAAYMVEKKSGIACGICGEKAKS